MLKLSDIFEKMSKINVNEKTENKNGLTYLSWAWAWAEFVKKCPDATYEVVKFDDGRPYFYDENTGYMVYTRVTAGGLTHEMWLPVMDYKNRAMLGRKSDNGAAPATMFDINKTIMRCLTKNLAMFGLGLYIYAGEDLPEEDKLPKADKYTIELIEEYMDKLKTDKKKMLAYYHVSALSDLDIEQAQHCKAVLEKKIKEAEK